MRPKRKPRKCFLRKRKLIEAEEADAEDLKWLEDLQNKIKNKNKE